MEGMDSPGDSDNQQGLDELLDQAHFNVRQRAGSYKVVLEK